MHIVEAFGRIFISTLFIVEAIRKILFKEETIFYMEEFAVPEILFSEQNEEIIGSEFYVMKYVSGEAPSDNPPYHMDPEGMMGRASPDQIRSVWFGWLENLVSFHKINYEDLEKLESYGRYLDSDNDGICYRTYPGTHPEKGAYFTRGTSHDEYARYTEDGNVNAETLMRLMRKFRTASELVPEPLIEINGEDSCGIIFYGSSKPAVLEAKDILKTKNINVDLIKN